MQKFIKMNEKSITLDINKIPLNSSLGLLAYGHVAFKAWRKIKKEHKVKMDEKK